jgi:hypothetical protein
MNNKVLLGYLKIRDVKYCIYKYSHIILLKAFVYWKAVTSSEPNAAMWGPVFSRQVININQMGDARHDAMHYSTQLTSVVLRVKLLANTGIRVSSEHIKTAP